VIRTGNKHDDYERVRVFLEGVYYSIANGSDYEVTPEAANALLSKCSNGPIARKVSGSEHFEVDFDPDGLAATIRVEGNVVDVICESDSRQVAANALYAVSEYAVDHDCSFVIKRGSVQRYEFRARDFRSMLVAVSKS
jgi:hypothetical protein